MAQADLTERLARVEGGYEHLATKADLANVRGELKADLAAMEGRLLWRAGLLVIMANGATVAAVVGLLQVV